MSIYVASENIEIILWQNSRRLAYYIGKIRDILHWEHCNETFAANVHNEILMIPAKCFPGSIAPKLELSVRICIKEKCSNCRMMVMTEKTLKPKDICDTNETGGRKFRSCSNCSQTKQSISGYESGGDHRSEKYFRQRSVCHSRPNQKYYI